MKMDAIKLTCDDCGMDLEQSAEMAGHVVECEGCGKDLTVPESVKGAAPQNSGENAYQQVADKVGFVPNVKKSDNILQAILVVAGLVVGAGIGTAIGGVPIGTGLGAICGLIAGGFIGGIIVMIRGMRR